jgi:glyoxylase-like metal-dependent hydrolase (beta-lactamase superfamily II)
VAGESRLSKHRHCRWGERDFDDLRFTVIDLGPSESPHDSPWILGHEAKTVFLGDQIYGHKHCYLSDGLYSEWLANIEKLRARFPDDAVFHTGHDGPFGAEMWDWQRGYIELFLESVSSAEWSDPSRRRRRLLRA